VPVFIGGHNDAVFSLVKPGVVVSTYHHNNYTDTLPGWQVKYIENQSWNAIPAWRQLKHSNKGRWWIPDSQDNSEFNSFVETWLGHWLGFVAETVFDVNMLQINERTVLVNNYNKDMFEFSTLKLFFKYSLILFSLISRLFLIFKNLVFCFILIHTMCISFQKYTYFNFKMFVY
jgi:hypothetical protein